MLSAFCLRFMLFLFALSFCFGVHGVCLCYCLGLAVLRCLLWVSSFVAYGGFAHFKVFGNFILDRLRGCFAVKYFCGLFGELVALCFGFGCFGICDFV